MFLGHIANDAHRVESVDSQPFIPDLIRLRLVKNARGASVKLFEMQKKGETGPASLFTVDRTCRKRSGRRFHG